MHHCTASRTRVLMRYTTSCCALRSCMRLASRARSTLCVADEEVRVLGTTANVSGLLCSNASTPPAHHIEKGCHLLSVYFFVGVGWGARFNLIENFLILGTDFWAIHAEHTRHPCLGVYIGIHLPSFITIQETWDFSLGLFYQLCTP